MSGEGDVSPVDQEYLREERREHKDMEVKQTGVKFSANIQKFEQGLRRQSFRRLREVPESSSSRAVFLEGGSYRGTHRFLLPGWQLSPVGRKLAHLVRRQPPQRRQAHRL